MVVEASFATFSETSLKLSERQEALAHNTKSNPLPNRPDHELS
jgi:hypothetical protein